MGGCGRHSGRCPQPCASISAVWPQRSLRYGSACTCDDWRCTQVFDSASSKNSRANWLGLTQQQVSWSGTLHAVLSCQKNEFTKTSQNHFLIFVVRSRVTSILESACSHLDQSYRCIHVAWSQQWSGRSGRSGEYFLPLWNQSQYISILSDALSREKLGSCYPGHERNIWICQTLAESNNAWVRWKFPAAFCTRQHQCCALVVVAAFESLGCHGCHGCHSTMSDSKSLEQSVRGDVHRCWWYHPGATHLQWVSLHWTASLKLKMKLPRSSCIQQLNQVCKQIVSWPSNKIWCISDVYWNIDRSLHTTTPHHTSRLHRMLPGHSLDWGHKGRSSGHVQPQGSTVTLTLGRAAVNCVNTLAALPELQVVEVLVLSRKSSLAP